MGSCSSRPVGVKMKCTRVVSGNVIVLFLKGRWFTFRLYGCSVKHPVDACVLLRKKILNKKLLVHDHGRGEATVFLGTVCINDWLVRSCLCE